VCGADGCDPEPNGEMDCGDGLVHIGAPTYLLVCASEGSAIYSENCRPVACADDAGCRESLASEYICRRERCQRRNPLSEVSRAEAFAICLASIPRTEVCQETPFGEPQHELVDAVNMACPVDRENLEGRCDELPASCTGGI
jgi:hypothetical protein